MKTSLVFELLFLALITFANALLAFLVYNRNKKNITNRIFAIFCIFIILWSSASFLEEIIKNSAVIEVLWRIDFGFAPVLAYIFFVFANVFPTHLKANQRSLTFFSLPALLMFILTILTKLVVKDFNIFPDGIKFVDGELINVYSLFIVAYLFTGIIILFSKYKKSSGIKKTQILYVLVGFFTSIIITILTNLIAPRLVSGPTEVSKLGVYGIIIFIFATAYSIVKHRLLDVKLVILRTISYSLVVVLISTFVVGITLLIPPLLDSVVAQSVIAVFVSIFLVVILDPLKRMIAKITDKLFFKARIDYDIVLNSLSTIINKEIDLKKLLSEVSFKLKLELKIQSATILLHVEESQNYVQHGAGSEKMTVLDHTSTLVQYLNRKHRIVVMEALERRIEDTSSPQERLELELSKAELDKLNAGIISPIITSDGRIAAILVLGGKLSGDPYSNDDLNLLQLLGPQLASALEKARLYEEIRLFNVKLQKEVEIATENVKQKNLQLEDRNRYLGAVQKVTNLITQTLEFKKVTQSIVDAIATELGFVGGVLLFLGESRHKVFPEAITNSGITEKILKLYPSP